MTKKLNKSSFQKRNLILTFFLWISLFSFSQEVVFKENKIVDKKLEELSKFYSKGEIPKALEISDYLLKNEFEKCDTYYKGQIFSTRAALLRVGNPKECYSVALNYVNLVKSNYDYYSKLWGGKTEVDKVISGIETETNKLVDENPSLGLSKIGSSAKSEISNSTASGVKKTDTKEVNIQKESKTIAPITDVKTQDNKVANNESEIKTKTEVQAQTDEDKTVTLTVTGTGSTSDEAKQNALRSAIEQAFGAFISSRTEILNDELISDQITSVSSGNIKSYELLNESQIPTGGYSTMLKAIVSVNKLTSFVQSKGVSVEIKGGLFAMNIKQQLLNEKAEIQMVTNLIGTIHNVLQQSFDYSLEVSDPKSIDGSSDSWEVPMLIKVKPNKNMDFCAKYLISNLKAISLSKSEKENYEKLNKPVYSVFISALNIIDTFYLRTENAYLSFNRLDNIWFYTHSFYIDNGIRQYRDIGTINEVGDYRNIKKEVSPIVIEHFPTPTEEAWGDLSGKLNFISSDENVNQVVYNYSDKLTLSELEKINKYQIFQDTTRNEYTNGGYQLKNVQNNCNIILSPNPQLVYVTKKTKGYTSTDQTFFEIQTSADSILKTYNNSMLNGHNDWRLASTSEIKSFVDNYVENNFDNNMFKVKGFYLDKDELKLIYQESHGSHDKFHWSNNARNATFLSSTMVNRANENGEIREYNILSYFDQFIATIKERDSDDYLKEHKPLDGGYCRQGNSISGIVLLFIVRSNNN